jgi:hypothetical protein
MSSTLPTLPTAPEKRPARRRGDSASSRELRKPTGASPWPVMLIAGGPKAPNARVAARASASELIDRTLWLSWRERLPDALGATPGARFEIAPHDGTLDDFEDALAFAIAQPRSKGGKPNLIVVDGWQQLGDSIRDWGREAAPDRSYWFAVNERRGAILEALRSHDGPVLLVGRLGGDATLGAKDLADDVDVLVELDEFGAGVVTGTRTEPPLHGVEAEFEAETVWLLLKLDEVRS